METWNPEQTLADLIDFQPTAFIASVDADGFPNLKAMLAPRQRLGLREFWFTTNTSSMRVAQYQAEPKAAIYFMDGTSFRGVMLRGRMEIREDAATKAMIWQDGDTRYYPLGPTDPDYCVLHFTAEDGRYYSALHSQNFTVAQALPHKET